MAVQEQSCLYLAFLKKWIPESGFVFTYVRMKSHQSPDTQGPQHDDIQSDFPVPHQRKKFAVLNYSPYLSYIAEEELGTRLTLGCTTARIPSKGMQRKCGNKRWVWSSLSLSQGFRQLSESLQLWKPAATSAAACVWITVLKEDTYGNGTAPHLTVGQMMGTVSQGCSFGWLWNSSRSMNSLLCAELSGVGTSWVLCNHS